MVCNTTYPEIMCPGLVKESIPAVMYSELEYTISVQLQETYIRPTAQCYFLFTLYRKKTGYKPPLLGISYCSKVTFPSKVYQCFSWIMLYVLNQIKST